MTVSKEFVRSQFEAIGYHLLEDYVKSKIPVKFRCSNGHEHQMTTGSLRQGTRCAYCSKKKVDKNHVRKEFASVGFEMLEDYKNSYALIPFRCSNGHVHSISWHNFRSGWRCAYCSKTIVVHQQVSDAFFDVGYTLLSVYESSRSKLEFVCDKGHRHTTNWGDFQSGVRCGVCAFTKHNLAEIQVGEIQRRITSVLASHLKRSGSARRWRDIYTADDISRVAKPCKTVYKSCPPGYHVDHIVPVSWFNILNIEELEACWNPRNLRYLPASTNLSRGNRLSREDIEYIGAHIPDILAAASKRRDPIVVA